MGFQTYRGSSVKLIGVFAIAGFLWISPIWGLPPVEREWVAYDPPSKPPPKRSTGTGTRIVLLHLELMRMGYV